MATIGFTWLALTYLAFLLYALLYRGSWISHSLRWSGLRDLGTIAYGTYIFHELFLGVGFGRLPRLRSFNDVALSLLILVFTLLFCRLSWVYFEKPLVKIGHRASYHFDAAGLAGSGPAFPGFPAQDSHALSSRERR
jgi:peptidoglycan/LPS O-acetylase OafA/YrhL